MGSGTVLIVDFDYENVTLLSQWLNEAGYRVLIARNGESGLERFKADKPDLVIIEPMLPRLHGFELSRIITRESPGTPVVLLSGFYQKEQFRSEEIKTFGAADFLKKPPRQTNILSRIGNLIPPGSRKNAGIPAADTVEPGPDLERRKSQPVESAESAAARLEKILFQPDAETKPPPSFPGVSVLLENRLRAPLDEAAPSHAEGGAQGGGEISRTVDALLEDALADLKLEPALLQREGPELTFPETAAGEELEYAGESPEDNFSPPDDTPHADLSEEEPDGKPAAPLSDPLQAFATEIREATPNRRISRRILFVGAAAVFLFPAYFILKGSRDRPVPSFSESSRAAVNKAPAAVSPSILEEKPGPIPAAHDNPDTNTSPVPASRIQTDPEATPEIPPAEELPPLIPAGQSGPPLPEPREEIPAPAAEFKSAQDPELSIKEAEKDQAPPFPSGETIQVRTGELLPLAQVDQPPVLIRSADPRYPVSALGSGIEGSVLVNALISENGDVLQTAVLRGIKGPHNFNLEAERAVQNWKFTPPKKQGVRVRVWKVFRIAFRDR